MTGTRELLSREGSLPYLEAGSTTGGSDLKEK